MTSSAKTKQKFNESFAPPDLAAIRGGIREIAKGKIEYDHPAYFTQGLSVLWDPDYPVVRFKVLPSDWYVGMTKQFRKDIENIDRKLQGRILQSISNITEEPMNPKGDTVKPLTSELKGLWRSRIGDFRLIYKPNPEKNQVTLVSFTSRGESY